jgi:hypothetical protein
MGRPGWFMQVSSWRWYRRSSLKLNRATAFKLSRSQAFISAIFIIRVNTGDSRYTRFRYPRSYFSTMRSINILSAATVEAVSQAHWVALAVSLTRPTFDYRDYKLRPLLVYHSENQRVCYAFPVLRVFDVRGDSQERKPAYNRSHLYYPVPFFRHHSHVSYWLVMVIKICKSSELWVVIWLGSTFCFVALFHVVTGGEMFDSIDISTNSNTTVVISTNKKQTRFQMTEDSRLRTKGLFHYGRNGSRRFLKVSVLGFGAFQWIIISTVNFYGSSCEVSKKSQIDQKVGLWKNTEEHTMNIFRTSELISIPALWPRLQFFALFQQYKSNYKQYWLVPQKIQQILSKSDLSTNKLQRNMSTPAVLSNIFFTAKFQPSVLYTPIFLLILRTKTASNGSNHTRNGKIRLLDLISDKNINLLLETQIGK